MGHYSVLHGVYGVLSTIGDILYHHQVDKFKVNMKIQIHEENDNIYNDAIPIELNQ